MKKTILLIALVMLTIMSTQAQNNIVKLGITNILNRTVNLEYERVLTDRSSVFGEFGIRIPGKGTDILVNYVNDNQSTTKIALNSAKYSSFYFVGEYRFYIDKKGATGLYLAPYLKLSNYSFKMEASYDNPDFGFNNVPAEINTGMFVASLGGGLGFQWLIEDRVAINWHLIGVGGSLNVVSASFSSSFEGVFEEWQEDVREFLDDIPLLGRFDPFPETRTRTIRASNSFGLVNLRTGISLGVMF